MRGRLTRRDFLRVAGVGVGAAAVAACAATPAPGAGEAPPAEAEATQAPAPVSAEESVKLTTMWRTNPAENAMLEGIVGVWKETYPNIDLEAIFVPWDEFEPKLLAMYTGGIAPDVIGMGGTNPYVERFVRGMVRGLRPFLDLDPSIEEGMWPIAAKAYAIRGDVIGLPWSITYPGFFYNATLLEASGVERPPTDWGDTSWTVDEALAMGKQLTLDKDEDGKTDQFGLNLSHRSPFYLTRLWGEDLVGEEDYAEGILRHLRFDDDAVYQACLDGMTFIANAIHKDQVTPSPETAQSLSQLGPMLKTGALAMDFAAAWALSPPLPEEFEFGAAAEPRARSTGGVGWLNPMQMASSTKYPDQAWQFMTFFVSDERAQTIFIENTTGKVPPGKAGLKKYVDGWAPKLVNTNEELENMLQGALAQIKASCPCHILVGWAAIRDTFRAEMEPVWLGTKEPKEALDTMIPLMNQTLEEKLKELKLTDAAGTAYPVAAYELASRSGGACGCAGCGASCAGCGGGGCGALA